MPRVLLAALPLLAGLFPLTVAAFGLGEIRLQSALNEPLRADIQIRADSPDEIRQLEVSLASPETFARFGLDRPAFLDGLRFQVERDGIRGTVRISSAQPVTEPFVSLLLDVAWPTGRLLREYTMLLDPPAFVRETAPRVSQPAVAPVARPDQTIQRPASPAPAAEADPVTSGGSSASAGGPAATVTGEYQVRSNDTLWGVANRLRPSSVSHNQMMVALFQANPEAFAGNINRLLAGAVLRVPGEGEIESLSGREANAEVARQNQEWQSARPDSTPRLQLVPPAGTAAGAAPPVEPLPTEPARPEAAPVERAGAAGTDPAAVAGLQAELEESRRLLSIKDDQLRALQQQLTDLQTGAVEPALPVVDPVVDPAVDDAVSFAEVPEAAEEDVAVTDLAPAPAAPPVEAREPAPAAVPVQDPSTSGRSLLDTLAALVFNVWFLASAAVILLAGLFVVFSRRRMAAAAAEETGRFTHDLRGGMAPATVGSPLSRDDFIVEETPHEQPLTSGSIPAVSPRPGDDGETLLERTISTDSGVEVDQADVIAEADFHMAYGLYDQAAALLGRALNDNPGRRDLRLKLLEVFFIWENKGAFLREAQAFRDQVSGAGDPEWNKVLIMGKQICPDEPLFAGATQAPAEDNLDLTLAEEVGGTVDIALGDGDVDLDPTTIAPSRDADLLDFDFGDDTGDDGAGDDTGLQRTEVALDPSGIDSHAPTMETPTIESPGFDSPTMETPTIESRGPDFGDAGASTMETPTLETSIGGTLESPTLENAAPGMAGLLGDEGPDQTEEINLEDLGLDLAGLDQAAGELGTGVHDFLDDAGDRSGSFDLTEDPSIIEGMEIDATAEMRGVSLDEGTQDQPAYPASPDTDTAENRIIGARTIDDTAEQPAPGSGETIDEPIDLGDLDFDQDEGAQTAIESTAVRSGVRRGPDGPTMTEVGTKLDLARAYVDMGDPDGARSILNEVLEEGDTAQRQQARQLLDDLAD